MKLSRIIDGRFHMALARLSAQPVPLKIAFKLKGIVAKVNEEMKKYEEVRSAALQKLGTKGEDGKLVVNEQNNVQMSEEAMKQFATELNELGSTDIELPTVTLAELGDKTNLTAEDAMSLDGVIVE